MKKKQIELKFITGNKSKFQEVQRILRPTKVSRLDVDLDEIQSMEPHKIIIYKLNEAFKHRKGNFIIEDGWAKLEALGGKLPGPLIKFFYILMKSKGIYELTNKIGKYKAEVGVTIAYAKNRKDVHFFESKIRGTIVKPKAKAGFGYDPIFKPLGKKFTLSEMKASGDFSKSPRFIAVQKLKKYLENAK